MDYRKQQAYLRSSRLRGAVAVVILLAMAAGCVWISSIFDPRLVTTFALVTVALAGSIYYTPDYLHLTVVAGKRERWQVKIRWRIIAAALLLGLLMASTIQGRLTVLFSAAWLAGSNLVARKQVPQRRIPVFFWITDLALLAGLLISGRVNLLLGTLLLATAAHLAIVTGSRAQSFMFRVLISGTPVIIVTALVFNGKLNSTSYCTALMLLASLETAILASHAEKQNDENIAAAMSELVGFTGYDAARIRQLWETSNQQLAKNWEQAAVPHDDRERMAEWYRDNSELYLFAISAYNLEYKRIKSNLKVIRFARGSCLDYGAGNGEILLELARRGHPVTYFDVEGVTMRFARQRAQQHGLNVQFVRTKDELQVAARQRGFDTIFSFDVLEHLPDLPGELAFLSSLLSPGGVFVFDVPAGSTKAHPMHLNHNLDVLSYLTAKGLKDKRTFSLRIPFRKEEKYVFQA